MEIYLVRHTNVNVERGICYGNSNVDVALTFEDDCAKVLAKLPGILGRVVSSPLKRCALLASRISSRYSTDDRLKELNFGDWEMKWWNEIDEAQLNPWMNDFVNISCPNGESYMDMFLRCSAFFGELVKQEQGSVAIVAHGGFIRTLLCHVLSIPLEKSFSVKIDYGSVSKISIDKEKTVVEFINL